MSVTLSELARSLELSTATVSCILNGKSKRFSAATVKRVQEKAQAMGYRPNASARAMRSGRFGQIALLLGADRQQGYLPQALFDGIEHAIADADLELCIARIPDAGGVAKMPRLLREWTVDGLLLNAHRNLPTAATELISSSRLPQVWINRVDDDRPCLAPDDQAMARQAVQQLTEQGHRRIAYVDLWGSQEHFSARLRRDGFVDAMREKGLDATVIDTFQPDMQQWPALLESFLDGQLTAFVTYHPSMALCLSQICAARGLRVPDQVSLLSFADDEPCHSYMPVDVLLVPWLAIGRHAVEQLRRLIDREADEHWQAPACRFIGVGTSGMAPMLESLA